MKNDDLDNTLRCVMQTWDMTNSCVSCDDTKKQRRLSLIRFDKVSKRYGDSVILDNVSFEVKPGERLSLIGPGGCGKTTMLKLLLGLEKPEQGSAYLYETDMSNADDA